MRDWLPVSIFFVPDSKNKAWFWVEEHHHGKHKAAYLPKVQELSLVIWTQLGGVCNVMEMLDFFFFFTLCKNKPNSTVSHDQAH